jgi:hypothetical protein
VQLERSTHVPWMWGTLGIAAKRDTGEFQTCRNGRQLHRLRLCRGIVMLYMEYIELC